MMRPIFGTSPARSTSSKPIAVRQPPAIKRSTTTNPVKVSGAKPKQQATSRVYLPFKSKHPISGQLGKSRQVQGMVEIGVQTDAQCYCDQGVQTICGGPTCDQAVQVIPQKTIPYSPYNLYHKHIEFYS